MAKDRYLLSFTTGGLFLQESFIAVELYSVSGNWEDVRSNIYSDNIFQARTRKALMIITREVLNRLKTLSEDEIAFFARAARADQKALLWLAVCRRYRFIADFAMEVIREKYLSLHFDLDYGDFDWFFNRKADWHPELETLTVSTRKKLRQVLFRMLREAELLGIDNIISPILLSSRFADIIRKGAPQEFLYFPIFEKDLRGM